MATKNEKKQAQPALGNDGIYDARSLGGGKMLVLGFQHLFAMFGATVLVPVLTGLSVSTTLLFAGFGTLLFHLLTKGKVPVFLGSSFAFLAAYFAFPNDGVTNLLPYACFGVACSSILYFILAGLIRGFGVNRVMRFFPPVVTGPIIICIGLCLCGSALQNCNDNWWLALLALAVIIVFNIWGKGMTKIIPVLLGVVVSYVVAAFTGNVDFTAVKEAAWLGLPSMENSLFSLAGNVDPGMLVAAAFTIVPISLATMTEHIGDICAISSTCNRNYLEDPGLHRTLLGDGVATFVAAVFGAPANTTYGENTGVLNLTKVYDPRVIRLAAIIAIILSFCPKFSELVHAMPVATLGGVSVILYGMISAVGVRNVVENNVDFTKSRNLIIAALIMVLSVGIKYGLEAEAIVFTIGEVTISLSGLATGALVGVILNAILPGKDYEFGQESKGAKAVNFQVGSRD
ncbi:MAG: uracil-xanthine permease family protein [Bacillota bacterium]|nr:uracil-xanthine permease family protein [Bacillota bacterium]